MDGLRQPRTKIVEPLAMGRAQNIERTTRANGGKPGHRRLDLGTIRAAPLNKAVLDAILCVRMRAQNSISKPKEARPCVLENLEVCIIHLRTLGHSHQIIFAFAVEQPDCRRDRKRLPACRTNKSLAPARGI